MKRSIIETALGAVVILVAVVFLVFGYNKANISAGVGGYEVIANFSGIGGLKPGDDVQISGVKIGKVAGVELDENTYLARVRLNVDDAVKLPIDTAALISSESLMGGKYLALEPGGDEEMIAAGGTIQFTQAPQNLEQLLGQFIFSMQKEEKEEEPDAPATDSPFAPPAGLSTPEISDNP
jgi:phospholipid/cholesterol/gamma-HCH transport system substrate-binding protein